ARVGSAERARGVHDEIDGLQWADGRSEGVGIGGVGDDVAGADLVGRGAQRVLATCGKHYVVTEFAQFGSAGLADAAAAAGDQCGSRDGGCPVAWTTPAA